jgi:hypothetical protein
VRNVAVNSSFDSLQIVLGSLIILVATILSLTISASQWVQEFLDPIVSDSIGMNGTLIVITFDESKSNKTESNRIFTIFLGPMIKEGVSISKHYNHYSILRTIEENFGLGTLGRNDSLATPITNIWTNPALQSTS